MIKLSSISRKDKCFNLVKQRFTICCSNIQEYSITFKCKGNYAVLTIEAKNEAICGALAERFNVYSDDKNFQSLIPRFDSSAEVICQYYFS